MSNIRELAQGRRLIHQLLALSTNDHRNHLSVEFFKIQNSSTVIEKLGNSETVFFLYTQLQDGDAIPGFLIYLCAGFTTSTPAVEFSSEESVASHRDGAKADEGEGGEDEKAKHVGVGHGDHEEELDQVEDLVEGALHAADHPSVLLLHLLLLDLKTFGGNFLDVRMTTIETLAD